MKRNDFKMFAAFPSYVIVGIGTSLVVLAAVIASFSFSRKGQL